MRMKLLLKTLFLILILILLVLMGMYNRSTVDFSLPPLLKVVRRPAALMYFAFFAGRRADRHHSHGQCG